MATLSKPRSHLIIITNKRESYHMAALSPNKLPKPYNVRCISLPVRAHPSINKIQEELCKLRSLASSSNSKTISSGLSGLTELYRRIGTLFQSPDIQQALAQHQHDNLMNELLEVSLRYLDICGNTKDAALSIKESVLELQSALRRKMGGDFSIESYVSAYICSRKKIKKEIAKSLASVKETDISLEAFPLLHDVNHQVCAVVRVLREASLVTGFIFHSLLSFLSTRKPRKWALVLKLVKRSGSEEGHEKNGTELEVMEAELDKLLSQEMSEETEAERIQSALTRSEAVEAAVEELEEGLEGLFRLMIQARVSLLNILSIQIL